MLRVMRQQHGQQGPVSITKDENTNSELARQMKHFLATDLGVQWLADVVDDWDDRLKTIQNSPRTLSELNTYVLYKFRDFLRSETGKRLARRVDSEVSQGTLMVPAYLVEQLIKMRFRHALISWGRPLVLSASWRIAACCGLVHLVKGGLKRLTRGWRRGHRAVTFVLDVMLPTHVFGALMGTYGVIANLERSLAVPG